MFPFLHNGGDDTTNAKGEGAAGSELICVNISSEMDREVQLIMVKVA